MINTLHTQLDVTWREGCAR